MIAYFDTSAFVKLLVEEEGTEEALDVWTRADDVMSSSLLYPEARSAIERARRDGHTTTENGAAVVDLLEELVERLVWVVPLLVRLRRAGDLAARHGLKGYDAVHLASATSAELLDVTMVTADRKLAAAARTEGLEVIVPS